MSVSWKQDNADFLRIPPEKRKYRQGCPYLAEHTQEEMMAKAELNVTQDDGSPPFQMSLVGNVQAHYGDKKYIQEVLDECKVNGNIMLVYLDKPNRVKKGAPGE